MAKKRKYPDLPERSDPNYLKLYFEKNKETLREKEKIRRNKRIELNPNYYKENYKKYGETHKKWRQENRHLVSEKQWERRGILDMTYVKFQQELEKQSYKCLICTKELKNPQVDHDHKTGKYRGILCVPCNNGLGIYEKKKSLFEKYLNGVNDE